jgi:MtfA peptidase
MIVLLAALALGCWPVYKWMSRYRRWQYARNNPLMAEQLEILRQHFPPYSKLSAAEAKQLELLIAYFLQQKRITPLGELALSEEMKIRIAAPACLMLVNLDLPDVFPGLTNIYLVPDTYVESDNPVNPATGSPRYQARMGEAWKRGPLVLSWSSIVTRPWAAAKQDLVLHEFAHHLDQQDGFFDGTPKLAEDAFYQRWAQVMGREFAGLKKQINLNLRTDIDPYGSVNEAEFFAVCTEYFFTSPELMFRKHPELYELLSSYFKLDPRKWDQ